MKRTIIAKIERWNESGALRKPLILMGARQVGKSWLMRTFAESHYPNDTVFVDLHDDAALCEAISESRSDALGILEIISTATGKKIVVDNMKRTLWCLAMVGLTGCVQDLERTSATGDEVLFAATSVEGGTRPADWPVVCMARETVAGEAPSLLPTGKAFRLVWHDEFNGTTLDTSKWGYRTNFWGKRFPAFAGPEDGCVEVRDGKVHLKVKKLANGQFVSPQLQTGELLWDFPRVDNPKGFWPLARREKPKFVHRYGYYECRFRLQRKPGWWSAFWMQSEMQGTSLNPEVAGIEHDIMESFYPGDVGQHMFHFGGYGADHRSFNIPRDSSDYKGYMKMSVDEFHTYGLLWEPDGYTVFVDGRQHGEKAGTGPGEYVSQVPEFLLISTECQWYRKNRMTGKAVPELEAAVQAKDDFVVDFVRVYDISRPNL